MKFFLVPLLFSIIIFNSVVTVATEKKAPNCSTILFTIDQQEPISTELENELT